MIISWEVKYMILTNDSIHYSNFKGKIAHFIKELVFNFDHQCLRDISEDTHAWP